MNILMNIFKIIFSISLVVSLVLCVVNLIKTAYFFKHDRIDWDPMIPLGCSALFLVMVYMSALGIDSINKYQNKELNNIINENIVEDYFIKDDYYYIELEGTDNYVKIPIDEIQIQD